VSLLGSIVCSSESALAPVPRSAPLAFFPSSNVPGRREGCADSAVASLTRNHETYHCTRSPPLLSHSGHTTGKRKPRLGLEQKYCCLANTSLSAGDSGRRTGDVQVTWYPKRGGPR